jgi:hypothetical protein
MTIELPGCEILRMTLAWCQATPSTRLVRPCFGRLTNSVSTLRLIWRVQHRHADVSPELTILLTWFYSCRQVVGIGGHCYLEGGCCGKAHVLLSMQQKCRSKEGVQLARIHLPSRHSVSSLLRVPEAEKMPHLQGDQAPTTTAVAPFIRSTVTQPTGDTHEPGVSRQELWVSRRSPWAERMCLRLLESVPERRLPDLVAHGVPVADELEVDLLDVKPHIEDLPSAAEGRFGRPPPSDPGFYRSLRSPVVW